MASVIAAHSRRPWVDALAWSAATSIAWERLRLDAHWASDVTAGALIGAGIGRWVVRRNRPRSVDCPDGDALLLLERLEPDAPDRRQGLRGGLPRVVLSGRAVPSLEPVAAGPLR